MKKNYLLICMALIAVLCMTTLSAQERVNSNAVKGQPEVSVSAMALENFRGGGDPAMIHVSGAARKGTVADPFGAQIGTTPNIQATEYVDGEIYGNVWSGGNRFGKVNVNTGAWTLISAYPCDAASMSYNPVDGKLYCFPWTAGDTDGPHFGTVDPATGNFTTITTFTIGSQNTFYAAIDVDGTCYAAKNGTNEFGTINLTNGTFTLIATVPFQVSYIQDMSFDRETGELYWLSQYYEGQSSTYYKVNKTTGALTQVLPPNTTMISNCFTIMNWYGAGGDNCPAVTNVTAAAQGKKVTLNWTAATGDVVNYKIYQGTEVGTVPAGTTTWTSGDMANGTYTFEVAATYADDCTPVKVAAPPVEIKTCDGKVSNLEVAYAADCGKATITWDAPAKGSRSLADAYLTNNYTTDGGAGYYTVDLATGTRVKVGNWTALQPEETPTGEDFDGTTMYRITNFGRVFTIAEDGSQTLIGTITGISNCIGLAYDWKNNDGYYFFNCISTTPQGPHTFELYKISLPSLEKTLIGTAPTSNEFRRGLALHADGFLYSLSTAQSPAISNLLKVDPTTGQPTTIGSIGFPALYGFEIAYDRVENVLYSCPIDNAGGGVNSKLISLNPATGASTLIVAYGFTQHCLLTITKGGEPAETKYNVYRDGVKIAGPIEATTFEDITFDKTKPHTWSVAVICSNGGDGEWVEKDLPACDAPATCDPITNGAVTFSETAATITWTAVTGATGYKVSRGEFSVTVTTNEAVEEATFVSGTEYTWTVITVCAGGESTPVEIKGTFIGINENAKMAFSIVPNPATNDIMIKAGEVFNTIEVVNFLGQTVISQVVNNSFVKLDISNFNNGIYFVRIVSENGISVKKFVKQ